jgi:hypothetical protein
MQHVLRNHDRLAIIRGIITVLSVLLDTSLCQGVASRDATLPRLTCCVLLYAITANKASESRILYYCIPGTQQHVEVGLEANQLCSSTTELYSADLRGTTHCVGNCSVYALCCC